MSGIQTAALAFVGAATYDILRAVGGYAWKRAAAFVSDWYVHYKFEKQLKNLAPYQKNFHALMTGYNPIQECCGRPVSECKCPANDGIETAERCAV